MIKWQPIETAPKDRRVIVGCCVNKWVDCGIFEARTPRGDLVFFCDPAGHSQVIPTHWAPINYPEAK